MVKAAGMTWMLLRYARKLNRRSTFSRRGKVQVLKNLIQKRPYIPKKSLLTELLLNPLFPPQDVCCCVEHLCEEQCRACNRMPSQDVASDWPEHVECESGDAILQRPTSSASADASADGECETGSDVCSHCDVASPQSSSVRSA
jgi:hypothetical protein